ncbi:MAG: hypothetical protein IKX81_00810 [Firmicutes bacterium]|nr:hypothetical protein [Bacillota bacterium]
MNKEAKLETLKKTSKVAAVFARIFEVMSYVGAVFCAVAVGFIAWGQYSVGLKLAQPEEADALYQMLLEHMDTKPALIIFLILVTVFLLISAYLMRKIGTLFRNINKDYTPFTAENVKLIKIIAVIGAVAALIEVGIGPAVVVGFTLWAVSMLFDYGCVLQEESDEIL